MFKNFPSPPKKHHRNPDFMFYSVVVNNEINNMNPNKILYNVELSLIDNLKTNNRIGTGMAAGTTSNASLTDNLLFYSEMYTLSFSSGTITLVGADVNASNPDGVFNNTNNKYVFRILCGTGKYTFKHGYVISKMIDDTTSFLRVYFTN